MNLRLLALTGILWSLSACQTENSNSQDALFYSGGGSPEYVAAKVIFSQSCVPCHKFHTLTEAQLKAQGLFTSADPEGSPLYYRLFGSTGAQGPKDMPSGGTLSSTDRDAIK